MARTDPAIHQPLGKIRACPHQAQGRRNKGQSHRMTGYWGEWLGLLLRWFHVVAAIAWIGESFYFVMLDSSLKPAIDPAARARGVSGELWAVHGGGFYNSQKYLVSPPRNAGRPALVEVEGLLHLAERFRAVRGAVPAAAEGLPDRPRRCRYLALWPAAAALAFLASAGRLRRAVHALGQDKRALGMAVAAQVLVWDFAATHIFAGRAAFLIVGAIDGDHHDGQRVLRHHPGQRKMVAAMLSGETPDPIPASRASSARSTTPISRCRWCSR